MERSYRTANQTIRSTWTDFDGVALYNDRKAFVFDQTIRTPALIWTVAEIRTAATIKPWAMAIINTVNSYTEVSAKSGTGVKIILRGKKSRQGCTYST
jgi:primase-polymerase (primpol)-like protein